MFRKMRRQFKAISSEEMTALLVNERRATLAVNGDDGYPYAIPVNYYYDPESQRVYFHSSQVGHKADALKADDKVCFTVYGNECIKDEAWAPYLQSVVIFGRCRKIEDPSKKMAVMKIFAMKYYPDEATVDEAIAEAGEIALMFEIEIEHMTGKLIQER
ncbi:MAG: pyridoxamine 5'-phosphate oxidase family protein [Lachnospiraceae bacterium]|nr:pyridoxamine 5'-phosphate oxidase family protein [Candidatus Equihabitans merdae]